MTVERVQKVDPLYTVYSDPDPRAQAVLATLGLETQDELVAPQGGGNTLRQPIASWSGDGRRPSNRWRLTQHVGRFVLEDVRGTQEFIGDEAASLSVRRFWFVLVLKVGSGRVGRRLYGLGRRQSHSLRTALAGHMLRQQMVPQLEVAVQWRTDVESAISNGTALGRWIPEETLRSLESAVPQVDLRTWLDRAGDALAAALSEEERSAIQLMDFDLRARVAEVNELIVRAELETRRHFFDKVERSPLTEEQARAVICFDNRVRVIADGSRRRGASIRPGPGR